MKLNPFIFVLLAILSLNNNFFAQNEDLVHEVDTICLSDKNIINQDQVERAAIPPNGFLKFREEVIKEIKMPVSAIENGIAGRVTLEFVICEKGYIHNVLVLKSKSEDCDQEAIRVLCAMGLWSPAQIDNNNVTSNVRYSFNFRNN